jgi:hypothetical protein
LALLWIPAFAGKVERERPLTSLSVWLSS